MGSSMLIQPVQMMILGVRGSGGLISALIRSENGARCDGVQCCAAGG